MRVDPWHFLETRHFSPHPVTNLTLTNLAKNVSCAEYVHDLLDGELYCNTIGHLKQLEGPQGDKREGTIALQFERGYFTMPTGETVPFEVVRDVFHYDRGAFDDLHVFCLHTHWRMRDARQREWGKLEQRIPAAWLEHGDFIVVITDPEQFIFRVLTAGHEQMDRIYWGPVRYREEHAYGGSQTEYDQWLKEQIDENRFHISHAMKKEDAFAREKELRILVEAGEDVPREDNGAIRLRVGDMRDIMTVREVVASHGEDLHVREWDSREKSSVKGDSD